MIAARRLKRNFKRLLYPFETALLWLLGPLALVCYWLLALGLHGARVAGAVFTHLRF